MVCTAIVRDVKRVVTCAIMSSSIHNPSIGKRTIGEQPSVRTLEVIRKRKSSRELRGTERKRDACTNAGTTVFTQIEYILRHRLQTLNENGISIYIEICIDSRLGSRSKCYRILPSAALLVRPFELSGCSFDSRQSKTFRLLAIRNLIHYDIVDMYSTIRRSRCRHHDSDILARTNIGIELNRILFIRC